MIQNVKSYKPLPNNLYIAKSPIDGMGLFASEFIPSGYELGITHKADDRFNDGYIRTTLGSYINHSYSPNTILYDDSDIIKVKTIKDINQDEELTLDYTPYYNSEELANYR